MSIAIYWSIAKSIAKNESIAGSIAKLSKYCKKYCKLLKYCKKYCKTFKVLQKVLQHFQNFAISIAKFRNFCNTYCKILISKSQNIAIKVLQHSKSIAILCNTIGNTPALASYSCSNVYIHSNTSSHIKLILMITVITFAKISVIL